LTHVADVLPQTLRIAKKLGVDFSESLQLCKDNMSIQKISTCRIQNHQLGGTANSALMGSIGHVALLVILKPASNFFMRILSLYD